MFLAPSACAVTLVLTGHTAAHEYEHLLVTNVLLQVKSWTTAAAAATGGTPFK